MTRKPQAETERTIRDRRIFYRWVWLVYAPLVLGFLAVLVFASGAMPGFLALPFVALLALDAISVRLVLERRRRKIALRVPPTLLIGVGATVLIDYSLFRGFGIGIRNDTVGVWVTGFVVAGMSVPWRALFGWLTHDRAMADETLGEHTPKVRAA